MILCSCSLCNIYLSENSHILIISIIKKSRYTIPPKGGKSPRLQGEVWILLWSHAPQMDLRSTRWKERAAQRSSHLTPVLSLGNPSHAFCLLILEPVTAWNGSFPKAWKPKPQYLDGPCLENRFIAGWWGTGRPGMLKSMGSQRATTKQLNNNNLHM